MNVETAVPADCVFEAQTSPPILSPSSRMKLSSIFSSALATCYGFHAHIAPASSPTFGSSITSVLSRQTSSSLYSTTESPSMLDALNGLLPDSKTFASPATISRSTKTALNEAILELEKANEVERPAESKLVNGVWVLKYSGGYSPVSLSAGKDMFKKAGGGYNPGLFLVSVLQKIENLNPFGSKLLTVGGVEVTITADSNPRTTSVVNVEVAEGRFEFQLSVKSDLDLVGSEGNRLKEVYRKANVGQDGDANGDGVVLPEFANYEREVFVTFLDDEVSKCD